MCTGITIALVAASAVMGAVQAFQQSKAAKAQYEYNAAVAANQAADAQQRAKAEEEEKRAQINQTIGAARARQAANGLLVDDTLDSTNVQLVDDLIVSGQLDILRIRDNADRESRGFLEEAKISKFKAKQESPFLSALGAGISGGAKVSNVIAQS